MQFKEAGDLISTEYFTQRLSYSSTLTLGPGSGGAFHLRPSSYDIVANNAPIVVIFGPIIRRKCHSNALT